ncbi:MAG TPA: AAA family ATPase, partial [bacterium]|nr:AAA family ATPase [bacterium]
MQIIENFPERLKEVHNIGDAKMNAIINGYRNHQNIKNIMLFLAEHKISIKFSYKLFKNYGNDTIKILQENPYILIKDIKGIGFKKADEIAIKLGFSEDDDRRIINAIFYILTEAAEKGHSFLIEEEVINETYELLKIEKTKIKELLENKEKISNADILIDENKIYLKWNYYCERGISERLKALIAQRRLLILFDEITINEEIKKIENLEKIKLSDTQKNVIKSALLNKVFVLTGGPGTGKTTITNFIVKLFNKKKMSVKLCSPTGRAAKRLSELTYEQAQTIHRLLEYSPQQGFQRNENNKLPVDVLIIDEFSMVDIYLFYNLLKALNDDTILIMIGDVNQLPSVSAGNLLNDIIKSEKIAVGILTEIFRQDEDSLIILNAHNIIKNQNIIIKNSKKSDFFVINKEEKKETLNEIIELFHKRLPNFGFHQDNIQILAPIYKGLLGVDNINMELKKNSAIQNQQQPNKKYYFQYGSAIYETGDRIIQLKNNYNKQIMNGDIGKVLAVGNNIDELIESADDKKLI